MANNRVWALIKLQGEDAAISGEVDMTNRHDVDNWMMGRRPLKVFVQDPSSELPPEKRPYDRECRLGPNLGLTASIMFLE